MQGLRKHILFYSIIAMMISLFVSRWVLSASILAFLFACFFYSGIKDPLKNFFSSPILWSMSLLFLLPLLSGIWSENKNEWINILRIKLPLIFLPLGFAAPFTFSKTQWHWLSAVFIVLITAGTIGCMFHYVGNMAAVDEGYLRAKTLLTPLNNDHVRFSWLVTIAILFAGWLWWQKKEDSKLIARALILVILWLIVFLHILAARTGLFSLYIVLFATALWFMFKKIKLLYSAALLVMLVALPILAYFILPSFHNKVKYFKYDFGYFKDAHYLPGGNDATRIISLKAGWNIMMDHPVTGVGFGDVFEEAGKWYDLNYPQMLASDKILPGSEWLMYGSACGIAGFLIFTFVLFVPFFVKAGNKWGCWLVSLLVIFSMLSDIGLEVQFGVFSYAFIVLLCWKWFSRETLKI
jgi:O-antigen ligase